MDPFVLLGIFAFLLAVGLFFSICGPVYISMWASLYWIYQGDPDKVAQVQAIKFDPGRVIEQYLNLLEYWQVNHDQLDFRSFTLPLFGPPAFGALVSAILTFMLIRYIRNLFKV